MKSNESGTPLERFMKPFSSAVAAKIRHENHEVGEHVDFKVNS